MAPPIISGCPDNVIATVELGRLSVPVNWSEPLAIDAITGTVLEVFMRSHEPGSPFFIGDTSVSYLYQSNTGGSSSCQFVVTVIEGE